MFSAPRAMIKCNIIIVNSTVTWTLSHFKASVRAGEGLVRSDLTSPGLEPQDSHKLVYLSTDKAIWLSLRF